MYEIMETAACVTTGTVTGSSTTITISTRNHQHFYFYRRKLGVGGLEVKRSRMARRMRKHQMRI